MSTFDRFSSLPPEIRHQIWDEALHQEVGNRLVLVHRASLRVLPHARSTRSAVVGVDREARARALRFYDVQLDVWTFGLPVDYAGEVEAYGNTQDALERYVRRWRTPIALYRGYYGEEERVRFTSWLWASRLRNDLRRRARGLLKQAPETAAGSARAGRIFLSSRFDRFALSCPIRSRQPDDHVWGVDLCIRSLLQEHECHLLGRAPYPHKYHSTSMATKLPPDALQRIRQVVGLYERPSWSSRALSGLGPFRGATRIYTAKMHSIPADALNLGHTHNRTRWRRTGPGAISPFEEVEEDFWDEEHTVDE